MYIHAGVSAGRVNEMITGRIQNSPTRKDDKRSLTIDQRMYLCNLGARSHVASSHESRNLVSVLTHTSYTHTYTAYNTYYRSYLHGRNTTR